MAEIRVLDAGIVQRIAAGEVVERPAAAAKELLENALDAGATSISVALRGGGLELLRVADNGVGMSARDAHMAFTRHATSKLAGDDLVSLPYLGFRGEALPSIAAVSRVTIKTRQKGAEEGVQVVVDMGERMPPTPAGCPEGTIVEVEGLFAKIPARLKFMRRPAYEAAAVADLVAQMALVRPDVAFRLESEGKVLLRSPGGTLRDAVLAVYGRESAEMFLEVEGMDAYVAVTGMVGIGEAAYGNRSRQTLCVNGRLVRSAALSGGLELAARERVSTGRFPSAVLHVAVPPEQVDVNVHPNKIEVRFRDEARVKLAVAEIARRALALPAPRPVDKASHQAAPPRILEPDRPAEREQERAIPETRGAVPVVTPRPREMREVDFGVPAKIILREDPGFSLPLPPSAERPAQEPPAPCEGEQLSFDSPEGSIPLRVIGAWGSAYVLVEAGEDLLIVDQHAGHERLLFDKLMASFAGGGASQPLMTPMAVQLSERDKQGLLENAEELAAIGLEFLDFGPREIRVTAVPHILGQPQTKAFVLDAAAHLADLRRLSTRELKRDALAGMACKAAIKAGDGLTLEQMRALIGNLQGVPPTCPHGRPIYLRITRRELEKRFRRTT